MSWCFSICGCLLTLQSLSSLKRLGDAPFKRALLPQSPHPHSQAQSGQRGLKVMDSSTVLLEKLHSVLVMVPKHKASHFLPSYRCCGGGGFEPADQFDLLTESPYR